MKRIHISEEQIRMLKKETPSDVLDNIMTQVANDDTSLGHNPSLPNIEFQKEIISNGFKSAEKAIRKLFNVGDSIDTGKFQDIQSKLTKSLVEQETPIRDQLERIAQNAVIQMLRVPKNTVNMEFSLVDKVSPTTSTRLLPEENMYTFRDAKDKQTADVEIQKRRMVDALIKGASRSIFGMKELYKKELDKINKDLYPQYERLMAINDYLLYAVDRVVSDNNKGLKAYVGVRLGNNGKRTSVETQATLFPYLMIESVRGFFEFFSTHGLPADIEQVKYILSNADYLLAEQWDERFGTGLWDIISGGITETGLYPYVFTDLCKLEPKEFNKTLSDAFQGNGERLEKIISKAEKNKEFNQFKDDIELKNLKNSILSDGDMTDNELVEHGIGHIKM